VTGVLRWNTRVYAYILSLNDRYPPFTLQPVDDYPVDVVAERPAQSSRVYALFTVIVEVVLFAAIIAVPVFVESRFILHMVTLIFFYIAMTSAWNIPVFGGKMSLGHAAFFGLGGYTGAILYVKFGVSPWIGAAAGVAVSLLGGVVMTLPLLRLRGPFFTLASIAFAEVLRMIAIDWRSLTNGSVGLNIPFKPGWANLTFQSGKPFYFLSLILAVAVVFVAYRLRHSALGFH